MQEVIICVRVIVYPAEYLPCIDFGALADVDVLVTEAPLPADIAREAAKCKVEVVIA